MPQFDSIDKIVSYFACITNEPFTYKEKVFEPKILQVSPGIIRGFKCFANCGGCCPKFSLDYLPSEDRPEGVKKRAIDFNGKQIEVFTNFQTNNRTDRCENLNRQDGRCGIYLKRPFSCDFELIRFMSVAGPKKSTVQRNHVTTRLFSRGWNMKRTDGGRGALCEITTPDETSRADTIRKLKRLKEWSTHFGITDTKLDKIIGWCNIVPFNETQPLWV